MKLSRISAVAILFVRKVIPAIVGGAVLILAIAWMSGTFEDKIPPGQRAAMVRRIDGQPVGVVQEEVKDVLEEAVGSLKAARRTAVSAKIMATIESVAVAAGQQVNEGDVLVELSRRDLQARLEQAEEQANAATAQRNEAEAAFNRAQQLYQGRAITKSQFDAAEARVRVARAQESRSRQAVSEAQVQLSYATIEAPASGRVVDRLAEPGDTTRPGEPLLVLYDPQSLRLEAAVTESLAVRLQVGQELTAEIDAVARRMHVRIDQIVPQAQTTSRSLLVKAALSDCEGLYEGMFARLLIHAGSRRHLYLPRDAVQIVGQLEFVDVVDSSGRLERRLVKTGRTDATGRREALSGVRAGERVVLHRSTLAQSRGEERERN